MARTMPIRLRSIAAACVVIASCLIIYNVYKNITGSSDETSQALPIINADAKPFRLIPDDPGGADIPNQDSRLFELLKTDNDDPLALDGVVLKAKKEQEPQTLFEESDKGISTGFSLPEVPETRTESLYGMIEDLKERDDKPSREPIEVVDKGFVKMDEDAKHDLQAKLETTLNIKDQSSESAKNVEPETETKTPDAVVAPVQKPQREIVADAQETIETTTQAIAANIPLPMKKPFVPVSAKKVEARQADTQVPVVTGVPRQPSVPVIPSASIPQQQSAKGGYYIQLASLRDDAAARQMYEGIARDFPAVVAGMPAAFPVVDLGTRGVFTRIQIGPMNEQEAQRRCMIYTSSSNGGTCLVISR